MAHRGLGGGGDGERPLWAILENVILCMFVPSGAQYYKNIRALTIQIVKVAWSIKMHFWASKHLGKCHLGFGAVDQRLPWYISEYPQGPTQEEDFGRQQSCTARRGGFPCIGEPYMHLLLSILFNPTLSPGEIKAVRSHPD